MLIDEFELKTRKRMEIVNITTDINFILEKSNVKTGLVNIYSKHSTSGIVVNEDEPGLLKDFKNTLETLVPSNENYKHDIIDNNADSHLRSFLIGNSETIPLYNGKLYLGTWQSIFFVELDGPRTRKVTVTIV
jgi:secondary thiamine-phosphate synthase enzyme